MSNQIVNPGNSSNFGDTSIQHGRESAVVSTTQTPVTVDSGNELDLHELWSALRRRRKIAGATAAVVIVIAGINTAYQRAFRPIYQGSFALLITDPISNDSGSGSSASAGLNGTMFEELARNNTFTDIPTLIEVLRSPVMLAPIAKRFNLNENGLAGRIKISTNETEGVLKVSLTGRDPEEDEQLLDAISTTYLQAATQQRQQRLADGLNFLNKQEPALQAKTNQVQAELAEFRRRHSLLEPTEEGGALKQQEAALATQVLDLEAGRNRLLKVRQEIADGTLTARGFQEGIGGNGTSESDPGQGLTISDVDQSLLQQLLNVETELAEARSKYNPESSMVRGLEARLNQLQPLLRKNQLEAVDAALSLNSGRLATARAQKAALNSQFLKQPALIKQYEALQTRLQINQANLVGLQSVRENFQLEIAQRTVPWRVIDPPEMNPNPIKPSVSRSLTLGAVLGVIAGAGAGLLRDRMDHVYHQSGQVTEELGLPLLGHIPYVSIFEGMRENNSYLIKEFDDALDQLQDQNSKIDAEARKRLRHQRFFYQEAFRNLVTSIRFLNSDHQLRSLALTSAQPAEGKSLVNILLAKTLAEMGQRVLLIDADLRKPQLHTRLGLNNLRGLTNLLTDDDIDWRTTVQTMPGYESWSLITSGRRPPDPTRLLSSDRMHRLVKELQDSGQYDLILFDTPPVLGLADSALVAEHCEGLMLLVSLNRVDRSLPKEAVARILNSRAPLVGVVTNETSKQQGLHEYDYERQYRYGKYGDILSNGGSYSYLINSYAYYSDLAEDDQENNNANIAVNPTQITSAPTTTNWRTTLRKRRFQLMRWLDS